MKLLYVSTDMLSLLVSRTAAEVTGGGVREWDARQGNTGVSPRASEATMGVGILSFAGHGTPCPYGSRGYFHRSDSHSI